MLPIFEQNHLVIVANSKSSNMTTRLFLLFITPVVILLSQSCTWQNEDELFPVKINTSDTIVNYTTHIAPILAAHCNSCHSSGQFPEMSNFQQAVQHAERIRVRAVLGTGGPMPPTGLIPESSRQLITRWIQQGMRE
jgi:uncharacterized membrane protein